ncbi:unnamed protein product [Choristocarpus tenellus]
MVTRRPAGMTAVVRRNMSGDSELAAGEMVKWRKMSAGMLGFCAVVGVWVAATEEHPHPHEGPQVLHYYPNILVTVQSHTVTAHKSCCLSCDSAPSSMLLCS